MPDMPYVQFFEMFESVYQNIVYAALMERFNHEIQRYYQITGIAAMPDGKVVLRMTRKMIFDKEETP